MSKSYRSSQAAFKENPQLISHFIAKIANVLDKGDSVEIKKNRDGTPKLTRIRRETL